MTALIPFQVGFTEVFKPGRASPAGKGVLASTMCCGQTPGAPGQLYPGWTLALKTMMEMSTSSRDALLMVLPRTSHLARWCHRAAGSISCPPWVAGLGEASPVFAGGKLRIRGQRWSQGEVPGLPLSQVSPPTLPRHQRQGQQRSDQPPASTTPEQRIKFTGTHLIPPLPEICHGAGTPSLRAASPNTVRGVRGTVQHHQASLSPPSSHPNSPKQRQMKQSRRLGELD